MNCFLGDLRAKCGVLAAHHVTVGYIVIRPMIKRLCASLHELHNILTVDCYMRARLSEVAIQQNLSRTSEA
jgi:hypothetical protein